MSYKLIRINEDHRPPMKTLEVTLSDDVSIDAFLDAVKGFLQASGFCLDYKDEFILETAEDRKEADRSYASRCGFEHCVFCHPVEEVDEPDTTARLCSCQNPACFAEHTK